MASMVTSDLDDSINISVFEQSSPESLRPSPRPRPRALSPPTQNHSRSTSNNPLDYEAEEDYFGHIPVKQANSTRSSISSFPSSVIHTIPVTDNEDASLRTPSRSQLLGNGSNSPAYKPSSNSYLSAFRHPNSVRALQLESEYADSDNYSITRSSRHKKSPKTSYFSPRSPGSTQSSPTKRSTRPGTPQHQRSNSKLKKEFPLVLLHCTLLPPATTTRGSSVSEEILEAVLPEDYRKRWRTLQDKVVKNIEVKQRGVLIAHPRDDYDLLEERLLEALELERPRIRKGHYIGASKSDSDSGFESSSQNGTDDGFEVDERDGHNGKDKCPDCGKAVSCKIEQDRTWEVKIFAANGLMRNGAWSAAWEQMEKIDVEVAVWMPEDIRFEVEERLKALQAMEEAERPIEEPIDPPKEERTRSNTARLRHDERMREIYGEPEKPRTQEEIDGLADPKEPELASAFIQTSGGQEDMERETQHIQPQPDFVPMQFQQHKVPPQLDFLTFMRHHFRMIVNDQKNLAIVLLSTLVLFFSVQNLDISNKPSSQQPGAVQPTSTPVSSTIETPVISVETPVISYITTTVLATPSIIAPIAPPGEDVYDPQRMPRVEDYTAISEIIPEEPPASSTPAPSTTETSSVEPETETIQPAHSIDDQPLQADPTLDISERLTPVFSSSPAASSISDDSKDIRTYHQATPSTESLSQPELTTSPVAEEIHSQDSSSPPEEQTIKSVPPEETEKPGSPFEPSTETKNIDFFTDPDSPSTTISIEPHIQPQPAIEPTSIETSTLESPVPVSDEPDINRNIDTSPLHPKDTTPLHSPSQPSHPSHLLFTNHVCTDTEEELISTE